MKQLPTWWPQALAGNLLPPDAEPGVEDDSPSWLVAVFGFFGAYLVLLPTLGFLFAAFGNVIFTAPAAQIAALGLSGVAVWLLRQQGRLFVIQLGLNVALIAQVLWVFGWGRGVLWPLLLGLLALQAGVAAACGVAWVQRIFGVLAAWTILALPFASLLDFGQAAGQRHGAGILFDTWPGNVLALALLWAGWTINEGRCLGRRGAASFSALADGIGIGLLLALAVRSTALAAMLGGVAAGSADLADAGLQTLWAWGWPQIVQAAAVSASAVWLWRHWQPERRAGVLLLLVYVALLAVCPVVPQLGALALIGTLAAAYGKKRLLWLTLAVLLLALGNFYYALAWPLADKAMLLAGIGAVLAAALLLLRAGTATRRPLAVRTPKWLMAALALAALLPVAVVQQDVAQKEEVIAGGQKIYLPLLPRDPRSLLQGDYMALRFDLPDALRHELEERQRQAPGLRRVLAVAVIDPQGVARLLRLAVTGEALAEHERLLPLQQLKGQWVLVTDAYFFPEGQGRPLAQARFGEFRVLPDGRALLVGLADADLRAVLPGPARRE